MNLELLQEATQQNSEKILETKALTAKIKGLNGYLTSLLQKKIRIDLEIRRTKKQLTKLKKNSSLQIKSSIKLENALASDETPSYSELRLLAEGALPATVLQDFTEVLLESEKLLCEVEELPLYKE